MIKQMALVATLSAISLIAMVDESHAAEPYDINVILPLSGPGAFGGQTHQQGLKIFESVYNQQGGINGQPIHFVFLDDQTSPQVAVQLASGLTTKNLQAVIGSDLAATCRAMAPLFENGPVQYCLSPAIHPDKDAYTFSGNIDTKDLTAANLHFLRDKGWTRFAMISTTDASGQDNDAAYATNLTSPENQGMTVVDAEHFNPGDINVSAQLARIQAANPQVLIVSVPGAPFATVLRGMSTAGMLDLPVISTTANMVTAQLEGYQAFIPKELYFAGFGYTLGMARSDQAAAVQRRFADALKAADVPLDVQVGLPWDPASIIVDAISHVGTQASAQKVRDYIENLHDFPGIIGIYDFRDGSQRGLTWRDAVIVRWNAAAKSWSAVSKFGGGLQ